jgi:murein DD-endopeptidase MepM/ murein hydrolase activator NlpD
VEVLEKAYIVSPYNDNRGSFSHTGVDVLSGTGNRRVRAVQKGRVKIVQNRMEDSQIVNEKSPVELWAGNYVILEHGNGYTSRYNHLKFNSINVKVGDIIDEGFEFAEEGESGYATGVHLDFEIKVNNQFIDPTYYAIGQANVPAYQEEVINTTKTLILPADAESWRVYPMDKAPVVGNECGKLLPSRFGGLEYEIKDMISSDVAVIETRDFGKVQIYVAPSTGAIIK